MLKLNVSDQLRIAVFLLLSWGVGLGFGMSWVDPQPLWAQSPLPTPVTGDIYMDAGAYPPTPTPTRIPDYKPPVTTLVITGTKNAQDWYQRPISLTFVVIDDMTGPGPTWYSFDGGHVWADYVSYYPPISVTQEGQHSLLFYSEDKLYNAEVFRYASLNIDMTPPTASHTLDGVYTPNGWYGSPVTVDLTGQDSLSGIDHHEINLHNGRGWQTVTTAPVFSHTGHYTFTYRAVDLAGNISAQEIITLDVDATPPTTTHTISGTQAANGGYTSPVTVTLIATDIGAGLFQILYRLDGGPAWGIYDSPIVIEADGQHSLEYYATDRVNNAETSWLVELNVTWQKVYLPLILKRG